MCITFELEYLLGLKVDFNVTYKVIFVTGLIKFVEVFRKEAAKPDRDQAHLKSSDMLGVTVTHGISNGSKVIQ